MLLKFFNRGTGRGAGGVEYIIRKDDYITKKLREPAPEVLRNGDPAMTIRLIDDLDFKHKYTSGVISFAAEDAPTPSQQSELMTDFEKHAFAGLEKDAYNILWVRHTHTGDNRVELHFIIPMVELKTGKSLNIAPPGWQGYFKPWQTSWNLKRGWARPDDIERARVSSPGHQAYANKQRQLEGKPLLDSPRTRVTQLIEQKIESGLVRNRADIVQTLVANDYKILRTTSRSVTIKNPDWQGKENSSRARIRLKSGVFYADWTVEQQAQAKERDRSLLLKRLKDKSQKQTKEKFNYRAEKNRERYSSASYAAESKAVVTEYQDLQEFMEARLVTAAIAPTSNYPSNSAVLKQELEEFKQSLNLVEYAVSLGYRVTEANQADSNISYLTHPDGEQISISTKPNDCDRYTVVGSEQDQFTIIDLVQKRQNADLAEARILLQKYYNSRNIPQSETHKIGIEPVEQLNSIEKLESKSQPQDRKHWDRVLVSMGRSQLFTQQQLADRIAPFLAEFLNRTARASHSNTFKVPNGREYRVDYDRQARRLSLRENNELQSLIVSAVFNERQRYIADSPERKVILDNGLVDYLANGLLQSDASVEVSEEAIPEPQEKQQQNHKTHSPIKPVTKNNPQFDRGYGE